MKREALLKDWAELARKLKRLPTKAEYDAKGRYSVAPINRLWRWWRDVAEDFRVFARKQGLEDDWMDVLKLIDTQYPVHDAEKVPAPRESVKKADHAASTTNDAGSDRKPTKIQVKRKLPGRPVYGERISLPGLSRAPMNEDGVLLLFGMLAHKLGFDILKVQQEFPDCEAMREVAPGKWQLTLIEFEFESRSFAQHRHDPRGCDIIVCWRHNWPGCPSRIEVIELKKEVERLGKQVSRE